MSHIDLDSQDANLLRQNSNLFPTDPFSAHSPPQGRNSDDILAEKRDLHRSMMEEAMEFSGSSKRLVEFTADLAVLFHHNQFRKGVGSPTSLSHVAEVGKRAGMATELGNPFPEIRDAIDEIITPKAVVIALGRLHDAIEDFGANFDPQMISREEAGKVAEAKIRNELTKIVGPTAATEIVNRIKGLSLNNSDEFPDKEYVERIVRDPYMRVCKAADYDHNLETFPGFTETYPLLIVPAQYYAVITNTVFEYSYALKLLSCLNSYDRDEIVPWDKKLKEAGTKTTDLIKDLFDKYNETGALDRVRMYYDALNARLIADEFIDYIAARGMNKDHLMAQIQMLLGSLSTNLPRYLRTVPVKEVGAFSPEVSTSFVGNTPVQLLGPMQMWGGEIIVHGMSLLDAQSVVEKTGQTLGCRFPGYFYEDDNGTITYHISRYPRRAGLAVPPLDEFRSTLTSLYNAFLSVTDKVEMREEDLKSSPTLRVVLGLREGYFDQRKVDIEKKIEDGTFSDMREIRDAIADRLGDLSNHGVDVNSFDDPKSLCDALKRISLSVLHDVLEVTSSLGIVAKVKSAQIFSVAPDYTYTEEAALIEVPADRERFELLVKVADSMKQARFTVERLDTGSVINVEIKAFSEARSAKMI